MGPPREFWGVDCLDLGVLKAQTKQEEGLVWGKVVGLWNPDGLQKFGYIMVFVRKAGGILGAAKSSAIHNKPMLVSLDLEEYLCHCMILLLVSSQTRRCQIYHGQKTEKNLPSGGWT